MKGKKLIVSTIVFSMFCVAWAATASAWTYAIRHYAYTGTPSLIGTIPGKTYHPKVAAISNFTRISRELTVDLYYGHLDGNYEYSPNGGVNWITIANDVDTWTRTLSAGETIWLRVVVRNDDGNIYHILSPSPWGDADIEMDEEYYFAFPPTAYYRGAGGVRDITGYVAVVRP